jgi:hypothetical protein
MESVEAVFHEGLCMRSLNEVEGPALVGPIEESTVEVHYDENATRLRESFGAEVRLGHIFGRRIGNTSRGFAWDLVGRRRATFNWRGLDH